jgi:predicted nucleic-acid-binding Zn-ribbon protein
MFKLICGKCGSINVLEKSEEKILAGDGANIIHGKGVQRKCIECDNEDFVIFKTWVDKEKTRTDI